MEMEIFQVNNNNNNKAFGNIYIHNSYPLSNYPIPTFLLLL